ncbi:hypothetical protein NQ176_g9918 [Zarea fungicola]|uniref:Uncharacterized protein n=1 Tax=Zarea fungicola TaxID=93591 RepID=A0ACC1MJU1_9HYPO|nr:hypothetical protein NQ176_g9918 [Lecanicillium fungicola]
MRGEPFGESTVKRGRNPNSSFSHDATNATLIEDLANVGGPTRLSRTLGLQLNRHSQYIGHTTDFEPTLINLSSNDAQNESTSSRGAVRKVQDGVSFLLITDSTTRGYEQQEHDIRAVEALVAPHGRKLIDLFFRIVHPSFPICQKHVFIEKYERDYREFAPPLLATVYLLAINWWNHSQELASFPRPNTNALEKLVRSSLADSMCRPKLSTVEAALLLAQIPGCSQWTSTAQLVAMGQELGLHLDCSSWDIPPWEKGMRKRLSWGLYLQDKWGSLIHGRPSHISPSNWAVRTLTINDFPDVDWDEGNAEEKNDCETGRIIFMRFVQLTGILTEILDAFYSLVAMQKIENSGSQGAQMVLAQAKPIQLKLKEWYAGLPACVRLESLSSGGPPPSRPSSVGYLHLAYFAAEITLHRRIIGSIDASPTTVDPYLEHICRSAAKAHELCSHWHTRLAPLGDVPRA